LPPKVLLCSDCERSAGDPEPRSRHVVGVGAASLSDARGPSPVMVHLLRLGTFLLFLALGLRVHRAREPGARRRAINTLLAYALALSAYAGFKQWDDWPFSPYHILVGRGSVATSIRTIEFWGTDAERREWRIDPYAWSPLVELKLSLWFQREFDRLDPEQRERVLRFLFARAEASRRELAAGRSIAHERRLGPALSAPHWWLAPRPVTTAPTPYTALRVYTARWTPQRVLDDPGNVERTLLVEYRP